MGNELFVCCIQDSDGTQVVFITENRNLAEIWDRVGRYNIYLDTPKLDSQEEVERYFETNIEYI